MRFFVAGLVLLAGCESATRQIDMRARAIDAEAAAIVGLADASEQRFHEFAEATADPLFSGCQGGGSLERRNPAASRQDSGVRLVGEESPDGRGGQAALVGDAAQSPGGGGDRGGDHRGADLPLADPQADPEPGGVSDPGSVSAGSGDGDEALGGPAFEGGVRGGVEGKGPGDGRGVEADAGGPSDRPYRPSRWWTVPAVVVILVFVVYLVERANKRYRWFRS